MESLFSRFGIFVWLVWSELGSPFDSGAFLALKFTGSKKQYEHKVHRACRGINGFFHILFRRGLFSCSLCGFLKMVPFLFLYLYFGTPSGHSKRLKGSFWIRPSVSSPTLMENLRLSLSVFYALFSSHQQMLLLLHFFFFKSQSITISKNKNQFPIAHWFVLNDNNQISNQAKEATR